MNITQDDEGHDLYQPCFKFYHEPKSNNNVIAAFCEKGNLWEYETDGGHRTGKVNCIAVGGRSYPDSQDLNFMSVDSQYLNGLKKISVEQVERDHPALLQFINDWYGPLERLSWGAKARTPVYLEISNQGFGFESARSDEPFPGPGSPVPQC